MKNEDITFVITTFKSEKIIKDCLNTLPESSPKIIIENSGNEVMKVDLEISVARFVVRFVMKFVVTLS